MSINCSKCGELKPLDQYETYFHSTQQKQRRRRICRVCFYKQKVEYRLRIKNSKMTQVPIEDIIVQPVEDLTPPQEYIKCRGCKELKPPEDFYEAKRGRNPGQKLPRCRSCHQIYYFERKRKTQEKKGLIVKPVLNKPNVYQDKEQRDMTFEFMTIIGWTFDEEKQVFWKEGVKDRDKKWSFKELPTYVPQPLLRSRVKGVNTHPGFQQVDEIKELLKKGYTYLYVSRHFNMSKPTLTKILRLDDKEKKSH